MSERLPWEQLPGESTRAYHVFFDYLTSPPGERSMLTTASRCYDSVKKSQKKQVPGSMREWADKYSWEERVRLYDAEIHRKALAKIGRKQEVALIRSWDAVLASLDQQLSSLGGEDTAFRDVTAFMSAARENIRAFGAMGEEGSQPPVTREGWHVEEQGEES